MEKEINNVGSQPVQGTKKKKAKLKVGENKQGLYVGWQGDVATKGQAL